MSSNKVRTYGSAAGLLAAGLVAGGVLAGSLSASAADSTPTAPSSASSSTSSTDTAGGSGETALTGDTLTKVKAAVTAKYPGATFDRVETDSDGVYEAHITKADGTDVTVEVDKAFAVTGEEAGHGGGGHRGGGGGGAGETALTGDTLAKVKAAVTAKYAGATFDRVTTDSDGVYEADITKADGTDVTVEVDKAFAVTGEEAGHGGGHHGGGDADSGSTTQTG